MNGIARDSAVHWRAAMTRVLVRGACDTWSKMVTSRRVEQPRESHIQDACVAMLSSNYSAKLELHEASRSLVEADYLPKSWNPISTIQGHGVDQ